MPQRPHRPPLSASPARCRPPPAPHRPAAGQDQPRVLAGRALAVRSSNLGHGAKHVERAERRDRLAGVIQETRRRGDLFGRARTVMKCWRSIALRNVGRRVWRTQHPLGRSSITSPVEKRTNGEYASAVSPHATYLPEVSLTSSHRRQNNPSIQQSGSGSRVGGARTERDSFNSLSTITDSRRTCVREGVRVLNKPGRGRRRPSWQGAYKSAARGGCACVSPSKRSVPLDLNFRNPPPRRHDRRDEASPSYLPRSESIERGARSVGAGAFPPPGGALVSSKRMTRESSADRSYNTAHRTRSLRPASRQRPVGVTVARRRCKGAGNVA